MSIILDSSEPRKVYIESDVMEITPCGAGREVGRSCILLKFKGKSIIVTQSFVFLDTPKFDCGLHPAKNGMDSLPLLDDVNTGEIDLCLISQ